MSAPAATRHPCRGPWRKPQLEWTPLQSHPDWICRAALRAVHRGKQRYRVDREDNVIKLYRKLDDMAHASGAGQGHTSWRTLLELLYSADRIQTEADAKSMRGAVRPWVQDARRAGLFELVEEVDPDTGTSVCLRWRQLDPLVDSVDPAGVAQSVRAAES